MKSYIKLFCAALSLSAVASCSDFGDTNIDPEHLNEGNVPYAMLFSNAQHQSLGSDWDVWRSGCIYAAQWNQHLAGGGWWWSYGANSYSDAYASALWDAIYSGDRGAVRDVTTVIDQWKDKEGFELDYNIARVMRVYTMHRLTDLYGDIPYSEAGRPDKYSYPKYDDQKDIYMDMLKELDEAQAVLAKGGMAKMAKQDLYYQADASKWHKFANALMLRLAMRLTKVDPETAKTYAQKAVNNGLITEVADNCLLAHPDGNVNDDSAEPYAKVFSHADPGVAFVHMNFLNLLKKTNDPRIPMIACVIKDNPNVSITNANYSYGDSDPAIQKGLPTCYSFTTTSDWFVGNKYPELADKDGLYDASSPNYYKKQYSQPNKYTYGDPKAPTFIVTAAQTNLLLAEAAYRGWIGGDAKTYYENGLRAAMKQFAAFPNATKLYEKYMTDEAIEAYIAANPFDQSKALEQINTQYWITCFCDEYETFSNWRRSGYPELKYQGDPSHPVSGVTLLETARRFTYPVTESTINKDHYNEAVSKLKKGDTFASRVWWDAE